MMASVQRGATSDRPSSMWRGTSDSALPPQKRRPRTIMTSPMRPTSGWAAVAIWFTSCDLLRSLRISHGVPHRVGLRVTQQTPDRSADGEAEALHEDRRRGEPDRVEVRLRDHGKPERIGHPPSIRLAVLRQREHGREQGLELERRTDVHPKVELVLARVPEAMGRAVEYHHLTSGPELERFAGELHAEPARHDLELLHLE